MQQRREYRGPADLRAMQELTQRLWSRSSSHHVGDLAWGRFMFTAESDDWPIALWESDGRVVGWGWACLPDDLELQVDPAYPQVLDEILTWFDEVADGGPREITVLDAEVEVIAALVANGYRRRDDAPFFAYHAHDLANLPAPELPAGFRLRAVRGADDLAHRVSVHQLAWESERVTAESYGAVMAAWPYRADLDWVVECADGRFAAYCLIWLDPVHRVGLIEPVGTAPEFRRRGLSRAVCLAALHALEAAGGRSAVVYPRGDAGYPVPQILYRGLGFAQYARTLAYTSKS
ncbi:GNAT family N-acetyltransferase [Nocardia sp. NPDC052566]|uniref:GNAT family N-acetyltransferase n=1 Tax=Nocardia sp. NPDC052566 TaxID=3364330 RepID=UPI0037C54496